MIFETAIYAAPHSRWNQSHLTSGHTQPIKMGMMRCLPEHPGRIIVAAWNHISQYISLPEHLITHKWLFCETTQIGGMTTRVNFHDRCIVRRSSFLRVWTTRLKGSYQTLASREVFIGISRLHFHFQGSGPSLCQRTVFQNHSVPGGLGGGWRR